MFSRNSLITSAKTLCQDVFSRFERSAFCGSRNFRITRRKHSLFNSSAWTFTDLLWSVDERLVRVHPGNQFTELSLEILNWHNSVHLVDQTTDLTNGFSNRLFARSKVLKHFSLSDAFASHSKRAGHLCAKTSREQRSNRGLKRSLELLFWSSIRICDGLQRNACRLGSTTGNLRSQCGRQSCLNNARNLCRLCRSTKICDLSRTSSGWGSGFCERLGSSSNRSGNLRCLTSSPGNAKGHQVHRRQEIGSDLPSHFTSRSSDVFRNRSILADSFSKSATDGSSLLTLFWRSREDGHRAFLLDTRSTLKHSKLRFTTRDLLNRSAYGCDILRSRRIRKRRSNPQKRRSQRLGLLKQTWRSLENWSIRILLSASKSEGPLDIFFCRGPVAF